MKKILIVDDSPSMRRMVTASLRELDDVAIEDASGGLEAIEKISLSPVDLMILDMNMPDMHGMDVLRFLRGHDSFRNVPVIVLTTKDDPASRVDSLEAGASLYLTKPFEPRTLSTRVSELLKR
jgi:two-component system, chemotaxis family, chemotaxis protein CheY